MTCGKLFFFGLLFLLSTICLHNLLLFAAFKRGLEMRAIIEDENAEDGVQLRVSVQCLSLE